ncbi:MAG: hypothetical protein AAGD25_20870 [Cyanobacteria bacterium P01_F01_bin.150]
MANLAPQEIQESATEVNKIPLPPVNLDIWELNVAGAGGGSPYIIKQDEAMTLSLKTRFSGGSLVDLLMCVGVEISVEFAIEGFGTATEVNLTAPAIKTQYGQYDYMPMLSIPSPATAGLTPGVYKAAAIVTVKPCTPCADLGPVAFGYITDVVFQVYAH